VDSKRSRLELDRETENMNAIKANRVAIKTTTESCLVTMELEQLLGASETISAVSDTTVVPSGHSGVLTAASAISGTKVQYTLGAGKTEVAFTGAATGDILSATSHGYDDTDTVQVVADGAGNLPTGLEAGITYYVISSAANTMQLSLTSGGEAVDITADGQGFLVAEYIVRCTATTSASQTIQCEGVCQVRL